MRLIFCLTMVLNTPEQEEKTMAMKPISIDDIEKVIYRSKDTH